MSRADDCAEANGPHLKHVPVCQRTGYANGRADALDEVEEAIAALVAEIEGVSSLGDYRLGLNLGLVKVKDARG